MLYRRKSFISYCKTPSKTSCITSGINAPLQISKYWSDVNRDFELIPNSFEGSSWLLPWMSSSHGDYWDFLAPSQTHKTIYTKNMLLLLKCYKCVTYMYKPYFVCLGVMPYSDDTLCMQLNLPWNLLMHNYQDCQQRQQLMFQSVFLGFQVGWRCNPFPDNFVISTEIGLQCIVTN